MDTQTSRQPYIWLLLVAGLAVRLAFMFITSRVYDDLFLGWIALLANLAIGYVLYARCCKTMGEEPPAESLNRPLILAAMWVFNPAAIFASTVGGFYEPIIMLAVVLFLEPIRRKVYSVAVMLFLPAALQIRFWLDAPGYASNSALNLFALIGGFRQPLYTGFWGLSYSALGVIFVLAIVLGAMAALHADWLTGSKNYYLIAGGYFALLFMFAPNMQVGSLFPVLVLLLLHYIGEPSENADVNTRDTRVFGLYIAFSATFFANLHFINNLLPHYTHISDGMLLVAIANVLLALLLIYILVNTVWPKLKWLAPPGETGRQGIPVRYFIWILLAAGLLIRVLAVVHIDFRNFFDIDNFRMWAIQLREHGLSSFYSSLYWTSYTAQYGQDMPYLITQVSRTDYPPVYLYVLYAIGALSNMLNINMHGTGFLLLLFLPAMLCDLAIGYVLYKRAEATQMAGSREKLPVMLAAFWVLNPAVILISSVWGQVASVYVLMLLLSLLLLRDGKLIPAFILFGLGVITYPLSFILAPVYVVCAINHLREAQFSKDAILRLVAGVCVAIAVMILVMLPFNFFAAARHTWAMVNNQIYGSRHAFNFFALIGGNMRGLGYRFAGLSYGFMGVLIIIIIMSGAAAAIKKDRQGGGHYFLIVGALFALMFTFSFRMTALYLFPALPFLLLYAIESRDRRILGIYTAFSATFFFNSMEVLRWIRHLGMRDDVLRAVSLGNVLLSCILLYFAIKAIDFFGNSE